MNITEKRKEVLDFLLTKCRNKNYFLTAINKYFAINRNGLKHLLSSKHLKKDYLFDLLYEFPKLILTSNYTGYTPNLKPKEKPDVIGYYYFLNVYNSIDFPVYFWIALEENKDGLFLYDLGEIKSD